MKKILYSIVALVFLTNNLFARTDHQQGDIRKNEKNSVKDNYGTPTAFDNPDYYYAAVKVAPAGVFYRQAGLSPDGQKIVAQKSFTDGAISRVEVVLMNTDGSGEIIISPGNSGEGDIAQYGNPFWSDDGSTIGYVEAHQANPNRVAKYVISGGTTSYIYEPVAPLDVNNADFLGSSTSAIVFWDIVSGEADIFTYDGTTLTNITNSVGFKEYEPVSNGDGTVILYWSGETTLEPVNTTHTLTFSGGTWTKDVGFTPIPDSYWACWTSRTDNYIGVTVMSTKDIHIYNSSGVFVKDLTGAGYSGGSGQWNFFGCNFEGPHGEMVITSNAGRVDAGRDIVMAVPRSTFYVNTTSGNDLFPGTEHAPFATIQKAINEAVAGGTIHVAAGTYPEHVTINKAGLTLNGTGANINGSNTGIVVTITANNVVFDGFQVQNSGLTVSDAGICLQGVTGCMIRNNTVINNFAGIALVGTTTSTVQYNFVGDNYFGIYLGIETLPSTGNVINDNNINNSIKIALGGGSYSGDGIYGDKNCHGNTFTINYIHNNGKDGIYFWKSFSNVVTGNTISNNTGSGIELMGSNNNDISENFINSNAEGIKIRVSSWPEGAYPSSPNSINDNRIVNNTTFALQVETQVPSVNATCNFYGSGVATYVASRISGPATYLPWLIDGSDSDADADNGFQPEPGKCIGNGAPFITVLTPNRGENWLRGTTQLITWDHNLTSNIKIDLYLADGVTFVSNIAMSVSGTSYGWTIPGTTAGGTYKVRICNTSNPSVTYDFSNYAFTISTSLPGAAINVTAPSGNPNIIRNSHYNIQWTKTNVPENVKIELYNPSSGYSTLTANVSGLAWDWWVPFDLPVASGYKIRVSSTNDSGIKDEETFSVALSMGGTVTLITPPIATATYPRNSTMTIAWNKLFTENVKIELWNPGTSAYETLAWSVSGTTWAWWIPSYMTPANGYKIKVSSVLDPLINSENDFNIAASSGGTIMLSSPAGGETWLKNTTHALSWIKTFSENVKIELWNPVSAAYELLAWSVGGTSWDWYIPHYMTSSAGYKIKVSSTLDPMISQEHTFTIGTSAGGSVIIGTPAIGSTYARNSKMTIAWTTTFPENVKIELWNPITSAYELLAWSVSGTTWDWWIPSYITPTVGYRVKISSTLDPLIADEHIFAIALSAGGTVFLTSPTGGETWVRNTSQTITWTKFFTEDVRIELLDPTTATWGTLAWSIGGSSFTWWIPNWQPAANGYTMRVSSVLDPSIRNEVTFNIAATAPGGTLAITAPLPGTTWIRNTNHAITWNKSFSDDVKIELYNPFNGGGTWEVLAWSVGGTSWDWWIPNTMQYGTNYFIRISRVANPSLFDVKQFTIAVSTGSTVAFTNPLGGENWVLSSTHTLAWSKDFPENVRIELYNPSSGWGDLAWSVGGTTWEWWIPNYFTPGTGYQLRVSSVLNPSLTNTVTFNVVISAGGTVTLTSPNGGEWWGVNTTHPITWTKTIAEDVKIELQKPDLSYETLTWATSGTSWSWWIPNYMPEGTYKIKISSVLVPGTFDESDDVFHIAIYDMVTYPNPVVSTVTLKTDLFTNSNCTVEVFNHFGVRLQTHQVSKQTTKEYTISMEGLPNNVYSIVVTSDSKRISKSVIVQH